MSETIVIIGAGPAGCALACLLAKRNIQSIVFDDDKRPELLVGESLVPAAIPFLREIGIEEQIALISVKKKGAALRHANGQRVDFTFRRFNKAAPDYAYNIPRPAFDKILRERAIKLGVKFISARAKLEKTATDPARDLQLSEHSLQQANLNKQPDLLVDASGRHRYFSKLLNLPAEHGTRNDVAYFAHYESFNSDSMVEGQVVLSVLDCGWSWQIPLQGKLSVGVVIDKNAAATLGDTAEQRLEAAIEANTVLREGGQDRRRVSQVMTYSNYKLRTEKAYGKGWVLLGDALGFVDPMLSPGVFMAIESANLLNKFAFSKNKLTEAGLESYAKQHYRWHQSWDALIEYFYDGRMLNLSKSGEMMVENSSRFSIGRLMKWIIQRVLSSMVSGVATCSKYKLSFLEYSCRYLLRKENINEYKIQDQFLQLHNQGTLQSKQEILKKTAA